MAVWREEPGMLRACGTDWGAGTWAAAAPGPG